MDSSNNAWRTDMGGALGTRKGLFAVAAVIAVVAGIIAFAAVRHAGTATGAAGDQLNVLVATQVIPRGASAEGLASEHAWVVHQVARSELAAGAITDAAQIDGRVAAREILPGQQLQATDFASSSGTLDTRLAGLQRAVGVPVDQAHGLVGDVRTGDRVDVYGAFNVQTPGDSRTHPVLRELAQNVPVLKAPDKPSGTSANSTQQQEMVLRLNDRIAQNVAFASENGKVWIALRGSAGSRGTQPNLVTLETVLFGVKPIDVSRALKGAN